jgi:hypothetical protein
VCLYRRRREDALYVPRAAGCGALETAVPAVLLWILIAAGDRCATEVHGYLRTVLREGGLNV